MSTKAERGEIYYERGTAPLGAEARAGSSLSSNMDGRQETIRAYKAPSDRSDVPKDRKRYQSWKPRSKEEHEAAKAADLRPKGMRVETAQEKQPTPDEIEDAKRLECPFDLQFRPVDPADYNFILSAWMKSFRDMQRSITNENYFHGQQNLIAELASRRQMVVGCDAEMPEWVAGFACGVNLEDGRLLLDYIYVKHAYRGRGIARGLISALGWNHGKEIVATHRTKGIEGAFPRYNASYNPFFNMIGFSDV